MLGHRGSKPARVVGGLMIAGLAASSLPAGGSAAAQSVQDATVFRRELRSVGQQQNNWCWATSIQMILAASPEQTPVKQCMLATDMLHCSLATDKVSEAACKSASKKLSLDCCDLEKLTNGNWIKCDEKMGKYIDCCALDKESSAGDSKECKLNTDESLDCCRLQEDCVRSPSKCEEFNRCNNGAWPEPLKKMGYASTYDACSDSEDPWVCPLEWEELKSALERAPVAFSWRYSGTEDNGHGHMMVASGYVELGEDKWVLIHDPFPPFVGDTMLISYEHYKYGPRASHWLDYYKKAP